MTGTVVKSKIVLKDAGAPAKVADVKDSDNLLLGTIIGSADGIKIAKGADQMTEFKGLKGTFECIPVDPERNTVRSGVLFLGEAFQADIVGLLEGENPPSRVDFGFEVYSVKAKNPAGYSWALKPLIKAEAATDPLELIKKQIAAQNPAAAQIAAPTAKAAKA